MARAYAKLGCRRIVALRGDPAEGTDRFEPHPEGFSGSVELIEALAAMTPENAVRYLVNYDAIDNSHLSEAIGYRRLDRAG